MRENREQRTLRDAIQSRGSHPVKNTPPNFDFRRLVDSVPVALSPRCIAYLDQLVAMEGFGSNREEVIRRFVWDGVNHLIAMRRLADSTEAKP
jgi:hypothetical protein